MKTPLAGETIPPVKEEISSQAADSSPRGPGGQRVPSACVAATIRPIDLRWKVLEGFRHRQCTYRRLHRRPHPIREHLVGGCSVVARTDRLRKINNPHIREVNLHLM